MRASAARELQLGRVTTVPGGVTFKVFTHKLSAVDRRVEGHIGHSRKLVGR